MVNNPPLESAQKPSYRDKIPAIRSWLILVAQNQGKVTYGDLMQAFDIDRFSLRHAMDLMGHYSKNFNEPIITALIVSKKSQHCSKGLEKEFGIYDDDAERKHLYKFWHSSNIVPSIPLESSTRLDVRAARFASIEIRPSQAAFRRKVFVAYEGVCAISGCNVDKALDAAHRHGRNWRLGHNNAKDGLLLRKDLHALYDAKLLTISEVGKIELDASVAECYQEFACLYIKHYDSEINF